MDYLKGDIGSLLSMRTGLAFTMVAAGAGDNALQTGPWIDRAHLGATTVPAFSPRLQTGPAESLSIWLLGSTTLAATKTLSVVSGTAESASDSSGTGAATIGTFTAQVVATGPGGGGTVVFQVRLLDLPLNLSTHGGWFRIKLTNDLNATATDTAICAVAVVLGGGDVKPAV